MTEAPIGSFPEHCIALQNSLAEAVAGHWPELVKGGSHCTEMSGRLAGAFDAASVPWSILDLSDRIGAANALDFHYVVESKGFVFDLTYRQYDPSAPVPLVSKLAKIREEWRDVRLVGPIGWIRGQMELGSALYRELVCD